MRSGGRIVVGVDGSTRSVAALQWALSHAERVQASVDVVTTWTPRLVLTPAGLGAGAWGEPSAGTIATDAPDAPDAKLARDARDLANSCVGRAGAESSPVPVRTWAMSGSPGPVLCDLVGPTDLLVVGPSGHGAILGAVLGSVANHLIRCAPCPVVVVRDDRT
jgi:nucleotide-binding universal stress UspA family protein